MPKKCNAVCVGCGKISLYLNGKEIRKVPPLGRLRVPTLLPWRLAPHTPRSRTSQSGVPLAAACSPRRRFVRQPRHHLLAPPNPVAPPVRPNREKRDDGLLGFLRRHPSPPRRRGAAPPPLTASSAADVHRRRARPGPSPPPLFSARDRQIGAAPPRARPRPPSELVSVQAIPRPPPVVSSQTFPDRRLPVPSDS